MPDANSQWSFPGARWWKFDFHTHTPASLDTPWSRIENQAERLTPKQWLLRFMEAEVDCVAVTDHNTSEWIDPLKDTYGRLERERPTGFRPLCLFPGVELSVNGGFHLLVIFDRAATGGQVRDLLARVEYPGTPGRSDAVTRKSAEEVVEIVSDLGALAIPAHVDQEKGLLQVVEEDGRLRLDTNTVRQVIDRPEILAAEAVNRDWVKHSVYIEARRPWTEVLGSDCHNFRGNSRPGKRYTWVKMGDPSLGGLRLALLDGGGFSIRRSDQPDSFDPFAVPKHCVEAIEIVDARHMGRGRKPARLTFSPWLNALVGGRGTGKSTVIHMLRLVARREQELKRLDDGSAPRETFERFNHVPLSQRDKGGLRKGTNLCWTVLRDGVRHRVRWRQDGGGTVVEDDAGGSWKPSEAQSVTAERFPLRVFSQGQMTELAGENQQALLHFIDDAAAVGAFRKKLKEARAAFYASRARIRELDSKLSRETALTVELQDVERKLKRFEEAEHRAVLTAYRRHGRQHRELERQFANADDGAARIEDAAATLQSDDLADGVFNEASDADGEAVAIITALADAVRAAAREVREAGQRLRAAVGTQRDALTGTAWRTAVDRAAGDYQQLVETLKTAGVSDPSEYGRLVQERQRLDSEKKALKSMRQERDREERLSKSRLKDVVVARRAVSARRERFLNETLEQNRFVRIRGRRYGDDPRVIEGSLREVLGVLDGRFEDDILVMDNERAKKGFVATLLRRLPADPGTRSAEIETRIDGFKERVVGAVNGSAPFGGYFNNYLARECKRNPELLDKLLAWFPEDGLQVEYSRGDGTDFRPIDQASAGQRAAAMLAFLLAHGEEPLILDQPEDDLDNHLIYDLVVRQIRENKLRRQIIVVTHNPNIVVNGDAEMLHALDFVRGQCVVQQSGSLQEEEMREEVCRVMEGGREAFERRYRRLGPEPAHVR